MGIKSTHSITKDLAIEIIENKFKSLSRFSDRQLCEILEMFAESEYRNYRIATDEEVKNHSEWENNFHIESEQEFETK